MQGQKYAIKDWAKDDRPREKLLSKNPGSLSNSELLAILIRTGNPEDNAVELAKKVLRLGKDMPAGAGKGVRTGSDEDHRESARPKAITIATQPWNWAAEDRPSCLRSSRPFAVAGRRPLIYRVSCVITATRSFAVIFLEQASRIRRFEILSQVVGITGTVVDPRVILKKALEENAVGIILCHNHLLRQRAPPARQMKN